MIQNITIVNHLGQALVLELRNPETSGFLVLGVTGLGPPKATVNMSSALSIDGAQFNSARVTSRNILLNLAFIPFPTIEETRHRSYQYFPLKRELTISVETELGIRVTTGFVESNEASIFAKECGTTISILCPSAYFSSPQPTIVNFSDVIGGFTFPFSNNSLTEKMLSFGEIRISSQEVVTYDGTTSVGFVFTANITGPVSNLKLYSLRTREFLQIDSSIILLLTGYGLLSGDEIIVSTVQGNKLAYLIRNAVAINILSAITPESSWLNLEYGDNPFYYTADSGSENIRMKIEFDTLYEGI